MNGITIYLSEHLCGDLLKEKLVFSLSSGVFMGWVYSGGPARALPMLGKLFTELHAQPK